VLSETKVLTFAWSWLVILGTAGTIGVALALGTIAGAARPAADARYT
jgi:hypothetical protein